MKTVLQVLVGLLLCAGIGAALVYSSLTIFWEQEDLQPDVYSLTWRSGVMPGAPYLAIFCQMRVRRTPIASRIRCSRLALLLLDTSTLTR